MATVEEKIAADRLRERKARNEFAAGLILSGFAGFFFIIGGIGVIISGFNGWNVVSFIACIAMCFLAAKKPKG
jgi:hypothetical protein